MGTGNPKCRSLKQKAKISHKEKHLTEQGEPEEEEEDFLQEEQPCNQNASSDILQGNEYRLMQEISE